MTESDGEGGPSGTRLGLLWLDLVLGLAVGAIVGLGVIVFCAWGPLSWLFLAVLIWFGHALRRNYPRSWFGLGVLTSALSALAFRVFLIGR